MRVAHFGEYTREEIEVKILQEKTWKELAADEAEKSKVILNRSLDKEERRRGVELSTWLYDILGVDVKCYSGTYELDGVTFTVANGGVCIKTKCRKCGSPLTSSRLATLCDIGKILDIDVDQNCPACRQVDKMVAENRLLYMAIERVIGEVLAARARENESIDAAQK